MKSRASDTQSTMRQKCFAALLGILASPVFCLTAIGGEPFTSNAGAVPEGTSANPGKLTAVIEAEVLSEYVNRGFSYTTGSPAILRER